MTVIKRFSKTKGRKIEVFKVKIGGKNIYFVSKITKRKIATGEARNRQHALAWGKRIA